MSRHSVRVLVEHLVDDQVTRRVSQEEFVQDGQGIDLTAIAAIALRRGLSTSTQTPSRPTGGEELADRVSGASGGGLQISGTSGAGGRPRAQSFTDQANLELIEQMIGDATVHESLRGLGAMVVLHHQDVRRAVMTLETDGVMHPLRLVLEYGPKRCLEVRRWVKAKEQIETIHSVPAMIVSTLKQGPPRGDVRRRQHA